MGWLEERGLVREFEPGERFEVKLLGGRIVVVIGVTCGIREVGGAALGSGDLVAMVGFVNLGDIGVEKVNPTFLIWVDWTLMIGNMVDEVWLVWVVVGVGRL